MGVSSPLVATALALMVISVFWHARLGLQVLIEDYIHDTLESGDSRIDIGWINTAGEFKLDHEWSDSRAFTLAVSKTRADGTSSAVAIAINAHFDPVTLRLPAAATRWRLSGARASDIRRQSTRDRQV